MVHDEVDYSLNIVARENAFKGDVNRVLKLRFDFYCGRTKRGIGSRYQQRYNTGQGKK